MGGAYNLIATVEGSTYSYTDTGVTNIVTYYYLVQERSEKSPDYLLLDYEQD